MLHPAMDNVRLVIAWILFSCFLTTLEAGVGPKFTYSPEPIVAPLGDEVEFECSLDVPAEEIRWKHNRKVLPHTYYNATKSQLIFRVEKESQVGEYQCVAYYGASALASTPAKLTLAALGTPTEQFHRKLLVTAGNSLLINCSVPYSNPPAGIQYYRNNLSLQGGQVLPSGSLLLTNVTQADSGQYTCSATNTYVVPSLKYLPSYHNLNVVSGNREQRPPQFTHRLTTEYTAQIGTNVTLECVGYGEPVPRTSWRRSDGHLIHERFHITSAGLRIVDLKPSDEASYICEISNGVSPSLTLRISLIVQEPPSIARGPDDKVAMEGGKASLECSVRGKPTPSIHWLLNGNLVSNDSHARVYKGRLDLERVEKRQAGWYQCMAQNKLGAVFASCMLQVVPRQVTFNSSDDLPYETLVKHSPPPHRKKHHKNKNKEMVPPSKPNVTRLTDTSVMVRWHVPLNSGVPIMFFKVQYRQKGKEWKTNNEDIPPHVFSYEVTNLTPNSEYRFRVSAVYVNMDNMQGPISVKFHLHATNPKLIPATPKLAHLIPAGANSIKIYWECNSSVPLVDGFYVHYRSTSSAGDYMKATVEGENVRSYVITHLQPDTAYEIKLQSFTVDAASDFSEILTQKTERPLTEIQTETSSTPPRMQEVDEGGKGGQQLYVVLGAVLGVLALLLAICTWIFCCNKHRQHHSTSTEDDDVDKSQHIQMETIRVNGHVGNHVGSQGTGTRDGGHVVSKATSNGCCSKMNITSNPMDPEETKTQNVMEIAFITTNSCDDNCSSSVLTARLASAAVLPTCGMESESWRRPDLPRAVNNYV